MEDGLDSLKLFHWQRGVIGYEKVLKYRGRVTYKIDSILQEFGLEGPDAYLKDKNGKPIPETILRHDKKSIKWLLEKCLPEKYGKHRKDDAPPQGESVLVIGSPQEILQSEQESSDTCPNQNVETVGDNDSGE